MTVIESQRFYYLICVLRLIFITWNMPLIFEINNETAPSHVKNLNTLLYELEIADHLAKYD